MADEKKKEKTLSVPVNAKQQCAVWSNIPLVIVSACQVYCTEVLYTNSNLGHICGEVTLFQTTILLFILINFVCYFKMSPI